MDENFLKLILLTTFQTLILLLNKAHFNKKQQKDVDEIIEHYRSIMKQLSGSFKNQTVIMSTKGGKNG